MSKVFKFKKKDKNRFRKVYRFIRKKPVFEFVSNSEFEMISGFVDFTNSAGPVVYTFPSTVSFTNVPVVTVTPVDTSGNNQGNINAYVTAITTTQVSIAVSGEFTGRVHFTIVGQD